MTTDRSLANPGVPDGETRRIWFCLAAAALVHAAGALAGGAWLWGAAPVGGLAVLGWALWGIFAIALVPGVAHRAERLVSQTLGSWCGDRLPGILAGALALAVTLLPDRLAFLGDFLLRQGTLELNADPGPLPAGALPLEELLHHRAPLWLYEQFGITATASGRLLGVSSAGALALVAAALSRRLAPAARGWRWALALLLTFGGWCVLFSGYSRASVEMIWIVPAAGVLALEAARTRRAFLGLSGLVGLALLLHPLAVGLVPVWAFAAWRGAREPGAQRGLVALGAVGVLAALASSLAGLRWAFDPRGGQALAPGALLAPLRLLDLANGMLALFPLLPLGILILLDLGAWKRPEGKVLAWLALPLLGLALVAQPAQGLFRDLDALAPGAAALAVLTAGALAAGVRRATVASWPAIPAAVGAVALALVWLGAGSHLEVGAARITRWAEGPPLRPAAERAGVYEYLGQRHLHARRFAHAAGYAARAGELEPSPRTLLSWAVAAEMAGDWDGLERASSALLAWRDGPESEQYRIVALLGLARVAARRGDGARFRELAGAVREAAPGNPMVDELLREAEALGMDVEEGAP